MFGGQDGFFFAQGGANRWQITIVDVEGTRLIAVLISYAETSSEDLSAAQGILDSVGHHALTTWPLDWPLCSHALID